MSSGITILIADDRCILFILDRCHKANMQQQNSNTLHQIKGLKKKNLEDCQFMVFFSVLNQAMMTISTFFSLNDEGLKTVSILLKNIANSSALIQNDCTMEFSYKITRRQNGVFFSS